MPAATPEIVRGSTVLMSSTVYTDFVNLVPANLTAATIKVMLKGNQNDPDSAALFTKLIGSGVTVISAIAGTMQTLFSAADTNSISFTTVYYEIVAKLADGSFVRSGIMPIKVNGNVLKTLF